MLALAVSLNILLLCYMFLLDVLIPVEKPRPIWLRLVLAALLVTMFTAYLLLWNSHPVVVSP